MYHCRSRGKQVQLTRTDMPHACVVNALAKRSTGTNGRHARAIGWPAWSAQVVGGRRGRRDPASSGEIASWTRHTAQKCPSEPRDVRRSKEVVPSAASPSFSPRFPSSLPALSSCTGKQWGVQGSALCPFRRANGTKRRNTYHMRLRLPVMSALEALRGAIG